MDKLIAVASKAKTPLALSGIVIVVLYAIYRQVLSLNVFENIGAAPTFLLLQNILDKVFWLAILAIILGVISYLVTTVLGHKSKLSSSNVTLVNASLDPHDSPYKQIDVNGENKIIHQEKENL